MKSCLFVGDNPSGFRGFWRISSVSARRLPILKAVEVLPQAVGNGSVASSRYISVLDRNDCSEEKRQAPVAIKAPKWAA